MNNKEPTISVIVLTYNRPDTLVVILESLNSQSADGFEVIVADDGSTDETKKTIESIKPKVKYKLKHVWHPDEGFRISTIRNKSVVAAEGDFLIFLDGDSVPNKFFIERYRKLAEKNYFISGNRVLLTSDITEKILNENLPIYLWGKWKWFCLFCRRKINRFQPVVAFGGKRAFWRYLRKTKWLGVRSGNMGVWRSDFLDVNGFDESYYGWGSEDSDLVVRLIRKGVFRKDGRFSVPIFHLWHPGADRDRKEINYQKLQEVINSSRIKAKKGVDQYV